jgi:phosphotransferase system HPr (HPr) family protein
VPRVVVRLTDALHARPANLFVRLAQQQHARVEIASTKCRGDAKKILDVLALGAAKGDEVEVTATGEGADAAIVALVELVERNFDADLVPETGAGAVEGIAIGRAALFAAIEPEATTTSGEAEVERAFDAVGAEVRALVAALGGREADLFAPMLAILSELRAPVLARVTAGEEARAAIVAETERGGTDLFVDARTRLLEALGAAFDLGLGDGDDERILVTELLTPSIVARLPPRVVGVVAAVEQTGFTSHAAILARGRDLPLAFVPPHVAASIASENVVVLDTTAVPARVWVAPSDALLADARARREERIRARAEDEEAARASIPGVAVRVNVGSLVEAIPKGAEGIGLLRTELVFAGRANAPSEDEQVATIVAIAAKCSPVNVRLFDAGGDKPLPWLPGDDRGLALLRRHPHILSVQLRAIARASKRASVSLLLPLVEHADDVTRIRAEIGPGIAIGAMIETPKAVERAKEIATASDFVCIGTNDLAAFALGQDRAGAALSLDPRVLALIARAIEAAHAAGRRVTICGEIAGSSEGAPRMAGLGADALSVAPNRFAAAKRALLELRR